MTARVLRAALLLEIIRNNEHGKQEAQRMPRVDIREALEDEEKDVEDIDVCAQDLKEDRHKQQSHEVLIARDTMTEDGKESVRK